MITEDVEIEEEVLSQISDSVKNDDMVSDDNEEDPLR